MRFALLAVAAGLAAATLATPASADGCFTPHVAGQDTMQVCMPLPIDPDDIVR